MKISMDSLCIMFSKAFDIIENEVFGATSGHSLRVASLCSEMGRKLGYDDDAVAALVTCALFHDNALTEHNINHRKTMSETFDLKPHCVDGQRNVEWLPFKKSVDGYVLHHHSCENGKGPFGVTDFPLEAALISAADIVDVSNHLQTVKADNLPKLKDDIYSKKDTFATKKSIETLLDIFNADMLEKLRDENIHTTIKNAFPDWKAELGDDSILHLSKFIMYIIDCKSKYTRKHSEQIANRAWVMGDYYGYSRADNSGLYLAAALHDIGKIGTPTLILEKPGKLDKDEYAIIMEHAKNTYDWLGDVDGLGKIKDWAAEHHEKLDGNGYPMQIGEEDLDFNSRLLACLDIYQAVCEERPYHPARSHKDTMPILTDMAEKGFIDGKIVKDLDEVMAEYSLKEIAAPI